MLPFPQYSPICTEIESQIENHRNKKFEILEMWPFIIVNLKEKHLEGNYGELNSFCNAFDHVVKTAFKVKNVCNLYTMIILCGIIHYKKI